MKELLTSRFAAGLIILVGLSALKADQRLEADSDREKLRDVPRWEDFVERNDRIYDPESNQPYRGHVALRYGNEGLALGHCRAGMLDGTSTSWYPDGTTRSEHTYRQGLLEGLSTTWYRNGQKMSQGYYRKGKLHGIWISWDSRGNETEQHNYRNGVRNSN